ncbi:MAG: PAS domain S-box protein, partial [Burkholderiales bacterium]|nr:PAS domain S-box protein [Opitutaceae bacterium]
MDIPAPLHVLLIEDSPEDRADIRQMLLRGSQRHYKFTETETGAAGVRAIFLHPDNPPDCVLLDCHLPDMDAFEVLAAMRRGGEQTVCPVVVVTGTLESGAEVIRAGAQDYVGKAWATPDSLTRAIENATERYALRRELLLNHAALRESQNFLQRVMEVAPGVIHVFDLKQQRFVFVSQAVASVVGYSPEEIMAGGSELVATLMHPEDLPRLAEHLQRVRTLGDDEHATFEQRVRTKSGEWRWFQNRVSVFARDAAGHPRQAIGAALDITERKRVEETIAQNAALFAKIIEQAPGGVYVIDAQFRVRDVNTEALPAFAAVQPVIGREFGEVMETLWGPELGREITTIFRRTLETGERYVSPRFDHLRHDIGVEQVYDWETQRITLPDGQHGVVCYFQDVTARDRAAEARRVSEERYRALVTASSAAVYRMSSDWSEMHQLNGLDFVVDTTAPSVNWVEEYLYPEDQPQVLAVIREAIRTKSHFEMEHRVRRVDGGVGWTSSHAIPLLNAKGEIIEWFGAAKDITARKQAEQARYEMERNYQALAVASFEIAYRMSADWSTMLPLNGRELVKSTDKPVANWEWLEQNIPREEHPRVRQAISDAIAGKTLFELEHRILRPDGSIAWTLSRAVPILDENGAVITWFGAASDITERKAAEEALREAKEAAEAANRSKDRFLAALSHELRTPLTPVLLVSEVRAKSKKLSKDLREDFEMIHRNIVLEAQLIDDLLDVSRIQQGKMRFDFKLVNVHEAIARALAMLRYEVEEKEMAVRQELGATPATLEADPARLRQVLCNLLRNAVKFTPRGGTITLHTVRDQSALHISIADTGAGIAAEDLERIFHPFEQVDAQQTSEHRSLGLGLAISAAIVAAHRGRIWA